VIVVIDSAEIIADPLLRGTAWKILAHGARKLTLRLCITEVVRLEAVAGYSRRLDAPRAALRRWEASARSLGLSGSTASLEDEIAGVAAAYEKTLIAALDDVPVEVLPVPDVDHGTLVERAANRIPPCDQNGDGYRDTLNWFVLLALADQHADGVLWVSSDSDFAGGDGSLHPTLQAELETRRGGSVTLIRTLKEAAFQVAAELGEAEADDMRDLQTRLASDALAGYVKSELLTNPPAVPVDAISLALPPGTRTPALTAVGEVIESTFDVLSPVEDQQAAVEVSLVAEATIVVEVRPGTELGVDIIEVVDNGELRIAKTTKPLRFTALLTVDQYDRPTGGDLTAVKALDDDPGHAVWQAALRRRAAGLGVHIPPETLAGLTGAAAFTPPPEVLKQFSSVTPTFTLPAEVFKSFSELQELKLPPEVFLALPTFGANFPEPGQEQQGPTDSAPTEQDPPHHQDGGGEDSAPEDEADPGPESSDG
jgi:hypothetical protein